MDLLAYILIQGSPGWQWIGYDQFGEPVWRSLQNGKFYLFSLN